MPAWSRVSAVLPPLVVLALLLIAWQIGVFHTLFRLKGFQLPYPLEIGQALVDRGDVLWRDAVLFTGPEAVVGLLIGGLAGFGCAVACASVAFLRRGALPVLASLNSIPIIAVSPIAVLWLGFGQPSKIAVVALMTFAPMLVNAFKGLYSIEEQSVHLMISFAASPSDIFWKLRLPHSLPYVFSALKVGTTLAMIGAVVSEFFNAQRGLGVDLSNNIQVAKMPIAWAAIVAAALLGLLLFALVSMVERALLPWHISFRES
ncbi:MAG: ABC transporter permease subunit [Chloroflexi bacterium]|nr:ABC transporter permease subunit [Chloroflexota bacterium]